MGQLIKNFKGVLVGQTLTENTEQGQPYKRYEVKKPGFINEFGEKKGEDEFFQITFYGDNLNTIPNELKPGDKVDIDFILTSKKVEKENGQIFFNVYLTGRTLKIIE